MSKHITTDGYCAFCTKRATTGQPPIASDDVCDCAGHQWYLSAQAELCNIEDLAWPYHKARAKAMRRDCYAEFLKDPMSYIKEWKL